MLPISVIETNKDRQVYGARMFGNVVQLSFVSNQAEIDKRVYAERVAIDPEEEFAKVPVIVRCRQLAARIADGNRDMRRIDVAIQRAKDEADAIKRDLPDDAVRQLAAIEDKLVPLRQSKANLQDVLNGLGATFKTVNHEAERAAKEIAVRMHKAAVAEIPGKRDKLLAEIAKLARKPLGELAEVLAREYGLLDMTDTVRRFMGLVSKAPATEPKEAADLVPA